jgi:hypothetical protein
MASAREVRAGRLRHGAGTAWMSSGQGNSGQGNPVRSMARGGKVVVEAGRHGRATAIRGDVARTMRRLLDG